jgi:hypothetical protein
MQLHSGEIWILIPLVSIILGIGMTTVTILSRHRRQMQELDNRHRERMAAIEKGLDLPPDPVSVEREREVESPRRYRRAGADYLLRGLIWLGVGVALSMSESFFGSGNRTFGWIAAAVGAAYLIYYALEGRRQGPPPPGNGGPPQP